MKYSTAACCRDERTTLVDERVAARPHSDFIFSTQAQGWGRQSFYKASANRSPGEEKRRLGPVQNNKSRDCPAFVVSNQY